MSSPSRVATRPFGFSVMEVLDNEVAGMIREWQEDHHLWTRPDELVIQVSHNGGTPYVSKPPFPLLFPDYGRLHARLLAVFQTIEQKILDRRNEILKTLLKRFQGYIAEQTSDMRRLFMDYQLYHSNV